jgi:zinc transport system substrate-binding protein
LLTAKKIQYNIVLLFVALPLLLSASWAQATAQKPLIITTIKPLAIIAKAAVGDQAQVEYLQSAVQSAHEVSLPVSALIRLGQADLVLWIGKGFEARISKPMALLPETKLITVMDLPMLPAKSSAEEAVSSGESEDDHHSHHHHDHLQFDPHIWLNPANGNILANIIQRRLKLPLSPIISAELVEQLRAELRPIKDRNYLTHHDAYAHFATAFDLTEGLSIRDASGAKCESQLYFYRATIRR